MGRVTKGVLVVLGVLLVSFVAQRLVSPADGEGRLDFPDLVARVERGDLERVTLHARSDEAEVRLPGAPETYRVEYPDGYEARLVERLLARGTPLKVESGRSGWLDLLLYLMLPGLFITFWVWLARRLPPKPAKARPSP